MIRAGLIGAGGIARSHAEGLALMDDVKITAVVDIDLDSAASLAQAYGAKAYGKLDDCLDEVDAVWILTPPSFHREMALTAMERGKHILCEKPISITLKDAEAIWDSSRSHDVCFMMGFNMRYRYSYGKMKRIVSSGEIGEVINCWSHRIGLGAGSKGGWQGYNWRTDKSLMCGMSIESLSHDIDMMRWLTGDIADVSATVNESIGELPGFDDNANVSLSLKNGGIASIFASWSSHITQNSRGVVGTKGTVIIEGTGIWDVNRIRLMTEGMERESIEIIENDTLDYRSYYEENLHFIDCIQSGKKPGVSAEDGLKALRVSHAILTSAQTKKAVSMMR